jgi:hypothetical protein
MQETRSRFLLTDFKLSVMGNPLLLDLVTQVFEQLSVVGSPSRLFRKCSLGLRGEKLQRPGTLASVGIPVVVIGM